MNIIQFIYMEEDRIIVLLDENDKKVEFKCLDLFKFKDSDYIILSPVITKEEEEEIVIMKLRKDGEEDICISIDDEEELEEVFEEFRQRTNDEFNF